MQESEIAVGTSGHRQTDCDSIVMEKEEPLNLRATAVRQLTSYDHMEYCWHSCQIKIKMVSPLIRDKSRVLAKEYRTVVPIYPKVAGEQEKWVAIYGYSRRIDVDVEQLNNQTPRDKPFMETILVCLVLPKKTSPTGMRMSFHIGLL